MLDLLLLYRVVIFSNWEYMFHDLALGNIETFLHISFSTVLSSQTFECNIIKSIHLLLQNAITTKSYIQKTKRHHLLNVK